MPFKLGINGLECVSRGRLLQQGRVVFKNLKAQGRGHDAVFDTPEQIGIDLFRPTELTAAPGRIGNANPAAQGIFAVRETGDHLLVKRYRAVINARQFQVIGARIGGLGRIDGKKRRRGLRQNAVKQQQQDRQAGHGFPVYGRRWPARHRQ